VTLRADLVGAVSAMAVGGFGRLAAHTLNFWLVAHSPSQAASRLPAPAR
jgi:hypothetical protein